MLLPKYMGKKIQFTTNFIVHCWFSLFNLIYVIISNSSPTQQWKPAVFGSWAYKIVITLFFEVSNCDKNKFSTLQLESRHYRSPMGKWVFLIVRKQFKTNENPQNERRSFCSFLKGTFWCKSVNPTKNILWNYTFCFCLKIKTQAE